MSISSGDLDVRSRQGQLPSCVREKFSIIQYKRGGLSKVNRGGVIVKSESAEWQGEPCEELPDEVLVYCIFRSLDLEVLIRIQTTCKKWFKLANQVIVEFNLIKTVHQDTKLGQLMKLFSFRDTKSSIPYGTINSKTDWSPINQLKNTEELALVGVKDDTVLGSLLLLTNIRKLSISFSKLSSVGIQILSKLQNLTHLSLLRCGYDSTCLAKMQGLKKLKLVEMEITKDIPLGLRMALRGLPLIERLPQHCIPP